MMCAECGHHILYHLFKPAGNGTCIYSGGCDCAGFVKPDD